MSFRVKCTKRSSGLILFSSIFKVLLDDKNCDWYKSRFWITEQQIDENSAHTYFINLNLTFNHEICIKSQIGKKQTWRRGKELQIVLEKIIFLFLANKLYSFVLFWVT